MNCVGCDKLLFHECYSVILERKAALYWVRNRHFYFHGIQFLQFCEMVGSGLLWQLFINE